ncbi:MULTISPECIES: hypothetical protein [unclassified Sphingopyxis]|uniref:hypothetical protein n=1 Tax=unclassified Sphingopyxis TaxID=2614943 RepID=UPI000737A646|nr:MULTISPECIES: hypothetical protein [unclassified Sphingopyxis]KTE21722.1 hypothetical protein ATE67_03410 [Sphingopyxis sp. H050]KTE32405.1 hypothetical protein ATE62_18125 [Sphingopyxis sp. HIX]KTE83188.1 hypothetical protein ATE72_15310 [Sphingopyxis sp. HXXIV]
MISITEPHGSPPEPTAYFIDESGHSGDLAATRALDFADQPVFALACIGVADARALGAEMERLRGVHGCGPGELKSAMARLPRFVTDLAAYLKARDCPVFIELVDKRFFIATHVVTYLLCGGLGLGQVPEPVRNAVAEFLTDEPADALLLGYLAACREPSLPAIRVLLDELWAWFDPRTETSPESASFSQWKPETVPVGPTPTQGPSCRCPTGPSPTGWSGCCPT